MNKNHKTHEVKQDISSIFNTSDSIQTYKHWQRTQYDQLPLKASKVSRNDRRSKIGLFFINSRETSGGLSSGIFKGYLSEVDKKSRSYLLYQYRIKNKE